MGLSPRPEDSRSYRTSPCTPRPYWVHRVTLFPGQYCHFWLKHVVQPKPQTGCLTCAEYSRLWLNSAITPDPRLLLFKNLHLTRSTTSSLIVRYCTIWHSHRPCDYTTALTARNQRRLDPRYRQQHVCTVDHKRYEFLGRKPAAPPPTAGCVLLTVGTDTMLKNPACVLTVCAPTYTMRVPRAT